MCANLQFERHIRVAIALIALVQSTALGQNKQTKATTPKSGRQLVFERLDKNGNQKLEVDEFVDGSVGKAAENKRQEFAALDLNDDEGVDWEEFRKQGNKPPDPAKLKEDFERRDKDENGVLTLKEFVGGRQGDEKAAAKASFLRLDANGDEQVSLEEFLDRDSGKRPNARNQFRILDVNEDQKLTEAEFMKSKIGSKWEQSARDNFRKFDLNSDSQLNEREFAITPANKPDAEAMFRGLDVDQSGELKPEELTRLMNPGAAQTARDSFAQFDSDGSGGLSLDEYLARESSIAWRRRGRSFGQWLDSWGVALLVVIDIALVAWGGTWIYRKFIRRSPPLGTGQSVQSPG